MMDKKSELLALRPEKKYFIGIDSDGCVFDSMEIKQKEFFIPLALRHFNLFPVARAVRETWEFVNLYSIHRGVNRFPALIKVFELLAERDEAIYPGCRLPDTGSLKRWVEEETRLSNEYLRKRVEDFPDPDLEKILEWSESINKEIGLWLRGVAPVKGAGETIGKIAGIADTIVVSQTPLEALEREWDEHCLRRYVRLIAGQEHGTKSEHIALAAKGKYPDEKILLVGDAFGDMKAAKDNNVLFFPVIPGKEEQSWQRLSEESLGKFIDGTYGGAYEDSLIREFRLSLPETPPWKLQS